jgi:hypothetical protein
MISKRAFLAAMALLAAAVVHSQEAFKPRSGAEAQAWRLYRQYKMSKANEAGLITAIKEKRGDVTLVAYGTLGGLKGVDITDVDILKQLQHELAVERALQASILDLWQKTFYWRYGDLADSDKTVHDAKTNRDMDKIEFAITYFQYYRDALASAPGATFTAEKGSADAWSDIRVTVGNVSGFQTEEQKGWRNNGTGFTAVAGARGRVPIRIEIVAKGNVSYSDYQVGAKVKTSDGIIVLENATTISKDGGMKSYSVEWDPQAGQGGLAIDVAISGGNPDSFVYYVSGRIAKSPAQSGK